MKKIDMTNCPDSNVLAEFAEGKMLKHEQQNVFLHIANCSRCRDLCAFAAGESAKQKAGKKFSVPQKVQKQIREKMAEFLNNDSQVLIAKMWNAFRERILPVFDSLEKAEVIAASETCSVIVFSSLSDGSGRTWKMELTIPAQLEKFLNIEMVTGKNEKAHGQLILCGNSLEIKDGRGTIAYEDLRKSFNNPEIAFIFEDGKRVIGYPEL